MLQSTGNIYNFCEVALKISGGIPISTEAAIRIKNKLVTSVTITTTERSTVGFLGTADGVLKKVSLSNGVSILDGWYGINRRAGLTLINCGGVRLLQVLLINNFEAIEYEELTLDSGNAVLPDTTFSPIGGYVYVLTTSKVSFFFLRNDVT